MISKRNFFVTVLMILVLLLMFQFSQIVKDNGNEYDTNEYQVSDLQSAENCWQGVQTDSTGVIANKEYVFLAASPSSSVLDTVKQWCTFTKRNIVVSQDLSSITAYTPSLLLVDTKTVDIVENFDKLDNLMSKGITTIFLNLPDVSVIKSHPELKDMLGIMDIVEDETELLGVYLLDGFLLGGEAVYRIDGEDKNKVQDFDLNIPYYITGKGTKSYVIGIKDETEIERKNFPRIIWRNSYNGALVFSILGDFCDSLTGLGILSAMVYESSEYDIYPIVNGHTVIVADYPSLTAENSEALEDIYSRNVHEVMRDIMWPGLLSMSVRNDLRMTSYIQTKYDYDDKNKPDGDYLTFYLQQFKEAGSEIGLTFNYKGNTSLAEKTVADLKFLRDNNCNYKFGTAYISKQNIEARNVLRDHIGTEDIHTLSSEDTEEYPLVSYYTDDVTLLEVTDKANEYSFTKEFRNRSIVSAIGYSNILVDMHPVIWPETEEDQWQIYFSKLVSNLTSYYVKNFLFDQITMSKCDERARNFLNIDYELINSNEDKITLKVDNLKDEAYFILRTHGKQIKNIYGGDYKRMGDNVFLIHATQRYVNINLETSREILEYKGPFK